MKHFSEAAFVSKVPARMTRTEKLVRWASIVRAYGGRLLLMHNLENMSEAALDQTPACRTCVCCISALTLATEDSKFRAEGLSREASVLEVMQYMELSQDQLHEFSCNCGGEISNREQADRIEALAYRR